MTLKKKVSRMQIEAGAEPNFLIIMMNNVQDPNASNPSKSAGKYLTYGEGTIKEKFISEGLQLDESYFLLANSKNLLSTRRVLKNKTSRPKRRQQRQTKKVQKTSLLKEFQHRLKTKHRLSKLGRQSSHKMKREPLVSSLEKL